MANCRNRRRRAIDFAKVFRFGSRDSAAARGRDSIFARSATMHSVQKPQIAPHLRRHTIVRKAKRACLRLVICADAPRPSFVARRPRPRSKSPADEAASLLRRLVTPREHTEERLSPGEDDAGVLCSLDRLCRRLNAGYRRRRLFDARVATASSQPPWGRLPRRRTA